MSYIYVHCTYEGCNNAESVYIGDTDLEQFDFDDVAGEIVYATCKEHKEERKDGE